MPSSPRTTTVKSPRSLPQPPGLLQLIGPSFILLGLALGSGELIMWPYLSAHYGLGLIWGGLLGISFQFLLNTETMRYALAWGESVFVGFRKISRLIPIWYVLSTFIPWSLPGFSSASAEILHSFFPFLDERVTAIALLILVGVILSSGQTLYKTLERVQKTNIFISFPFIVLLIVLFSDQTAWQEYAQGLVGKGNGWWFLPEGISLMAFLGAFAYSGAGGNLNLAQSYYIKEKGLGMGKFSAGIRSLFAPGSAMVRLSGQTFANTPANKKLWKKWWRLIVTEHALVFWFLGFLIISIMSVLSRSLVYGKDVGSGLGFLFFQAEAMTQAAPAMFGSFIGTAFLLMAAMMLFFTHLGILESSSRIISENIFLLFSRSPNQKANLSFGFYLALWSQICLGIGIYLVGWQEPRLLLTLAAILNAGAMMVSFPLIYWVNKRFLPAEYQPGWFRKWGMLVATCFFAFFVFMIFRGGE